MKKRIIRLTIILAVITGIIYWRGGVDNLFRSPTAEAVGDLSVDWGVPEGDPIFVVTNMKPGDAETRTVLVHNDASTSRPVGVRGIKTGETGGLATAYDFVIMHNGNDIYGGTSPTGSKTLQEFFTESAGPDGIFLSDLPANTSTSYVFIATFKPESENEFQAQSVVFDLQIGISIPTPAECVNLNLDGEVIFGTQGHDILRGTSGGDLIFAFEGNDIVQSVGGDDCIVAGSGNDAVVAGAGNDVILGEAGNDAIVSEGGDDHIFGGGGRDAIRAGTGNDTVEAGTDADSITGEAGDDIINGGAGNDAITGDAGNDILSGEAGTDAISGGLGNDTIDGGTQTDSANGGGGVDTCVAEVKLSCEI